MSHSEPVRRTGTVVQWRDEGYGWIREDHTNLKIYVHVSRLRDYQPDGGQFFEIPRMARVEYERVEEERGMAARDVVILETAEQSIERLGQRWDGVLRRLANS